MHNLTYLTEWIKALLAVPFVLHSQPTGVFETASHSVEQMATAASRRYEEIMLDVEQMIDDHSEYSLSLSGYSCRFKCELGTPEFFDSLFK